jgi:hypothetical protein
MSQGQCPQPHRPKIPVGLEQTTSRCGRNEHFDVSDLDWNNLIRVDEWSQASSTSEDPRERERAQAWVILDGVRNRLKQSKQTTGDESNPVSSTSRKFRPQFHPRSRLASRQITRNQINSLKEILGDAYCNYVSNPDQCEGFPEQESAKDSLARLTHYVNIAFGSQGRRTFPEGPDNAHDRLFCGQYMAPTGYWLLVRTVHLC